MTDVDAGVDDGHFYPGPRVLAAAAAGDRRGADERQVRNRVEFVIDAFVLCLLDERRGGDAGKRRAIELDRHRVERDVEVAGDFRLRIVRQQPLLVVVAQRGELRAIGLRRVAREVDLLAIRRLRPDVRRQRIAVQDDERPAGVLRRLRFGGGCIGSRRDGTAACERGDRGGDRQGDRRTLVQRLHGRSSELGMGIRLAAREVHASPTSERPQSSPPRGRVSSPEERPPVGAHAYFGTGGNLVARATKHFLPKRVRSRGCTSDTGGCTSDTGVQPGTRPTPGSFSAGWRKSMPAARPSRLISTPSSRASVRPNRPPTESW